MIKYSLLFFILFMKTASAQEKYKVSEGFYNLSSFEVASGMYLLENKTFFYYASFGNVDLKIFGEYSISNHNLLSLQVNKELTKEFYFYGLNNEIQNDSIKLYYTKPYSEKAQKLFINTGKELKKFPEFSIENNIVSITLELPKTRKLKIGCENSEIDSFLNTKEMVEVQLADGVNEIKIYHNYYSDMAIKISQMLWKIEKGVLTENNAANTKKIQKKEISKKIINEVSNFIKAEKSKTSIIKEGKTYQKL
ncbi:MAG: hypothetical protein WA839_05725 [Flavobacteriaceae bacterium]